MRMKTVRQMYLDFVLPSSPTKVVAAYRKKYGALNALLVANPAVLELVHSDFCRWLSTSQKGRRSDYTSEEILRCLVVMFVEQDSYRDVVVRIENSDFLRSFVGLGFAKPMMDFSFVGKAFAALSGETWHAVNQSLARHAKKKAWISGEKLRTDSTAYESNIHYPTDSSLLWDSFRVLCRTLAPPSKGVPEIGPHAPLPRQEGQETRLLHRPQRQEPQQGNAATGETHLSTPHRAGGVDCRDQQRSSKAIRPPNP